MDLVSQNLAQKTNVLNILEFIATYVTSINVQSDEDNTVVYIRVTSGVCVCVCINSYWII